MPRLSLLLAIWIVPVAASQPLAISHTGTVALGTTTTDQNGQSFTIAGMSGISWVCGDRYVAVMDNSNKLVFIDVAFASDGTIGTAAFAGGLTLSQNRDFEGVAFTDSSTNTVFLSEEGTPAVHEFRLSDGGHIRTLPTPAVFANRRVNNGFESLTRHASGAPLWTANEEALTVDGPVSSQAAGTVVRLLRYEASASDFVPGPQFAYNVEPWHGSAVSGNRSGLVELHLLPDGRLLGMERSLAFNLSGFFQTRIYEINVAGATDVSGVTALLGATYTPAAKSLLWSGYLQNVEGITLGPELPNGHRVLLGIVDDGDPISTNRLYAWTLSGAGPLSPCPAARGDANCDGSIDFFDIDPFLAALFDRAAYACAFCGRSTCTVDVDCSGATDFFDIDPFLECLFAACASCP